MGIFGIDNDRSVQASCLTFIGIITFIGIHSFITFTYIHLLLTYRMITHMCSVQVPVRIHRKRPGTAENEK